MSLQTAPNKATATPAIPRALRKKLASALGKDPGNAALQNLQGVVHLQRGELAEAVAAFRIAAEGQPDNAAFQTNLGTTLLKAGDAGAAIAPLEDAIAASPDGLEARLAAAQAHLLSRSFDRALTHAEDILSFVPAHRGARQVQAAVYLERRDFDRAADLLDSLVADDLENPDAWFMLGTALLAKYAYTDAARCLKVVLLLQPGDLKASLHFARALGPLGEAAQAVAQLADAIAAAEDRDLACRTVVGFARVWPDTRGIARQALEAILGRHGPDAVCLEHLAAILLADEQEDPALDCLDLAITLAPGRAGAHLALGDLFRKRSDVERAAGAFRRAVAADPENRAAQLRLAETLRDGPHRQECLDAFRACIALDPKDSSAWVNVGYVLTELGQHEEALDAYSKALALNPENETLRIQVLYCKRSLMDWSDRIVPFSEIATLGLGSQAVPTFAPLFLEDAPGRQLIRARKLAEATLPNIATPFILRNAPGDKIKVGYFSADFYNFAGMHLMIGLLERHDRDRFEISAFSYASTPVDSMHRRILRAVDHFYDMTGIPSDQIARASRDAGLDIALHRNGYTRRHRTDIFAHRAAPVQINYLGYPGTLGAPCIDYIIGDKTVIHPGNRAAFSENVIYMPASYQPNDNSRVPPESSDTRAEHGLPEDAVVLCSFNNGYKIGPVEFDTWCRVLQRHDRAVLWLLVDDGPARDRLRDEAKARGVDPGRLHFADRMRHDLHLARQNHADLFLDTFAYNAHTTASDALLAGLPVVTLQGGQFSARVCASLCKAAGMPELIAEDLAGYEAKIDWLIEDVAARKRIAASLRDGCRHSPLFDTDAYTAAMEDAFIAATERSRAGLPPADIDVGASMPEG